MLSGHAAGALWQLPGGLAVEPGTGLQPGRLQLQPSPLTLRIMLGVALVMVPVVIAYQVWAYRFFGRRLDPDLSY